MNGLPGSCDTEAWEGHVRENWPCGLLLRWKPTMAWGRGTAENEGMTSYTGTERASSTDPGDWGRALAVALERLLQAARMDGHYAQHERLFGVDLALRIEEDLDGANVIVRWAPEEGAGPPGEVAG